MESVTIGLRQGRVLLVNNLINKAGSFSWRAADAIGRSMAHKARSVEGPEPESFVTVSVRREGDQILIVETSGQSLLIAPLAAALEIGHALIAQARKLEELENAQALAMDQAILQRSGVGFGLTRNPKIQAEAGKEAAWNSDLRRYIPATHLRQKQVGSPEVRRPELALISGKK